MNRVTLAQLGKFRHKTEHIGVDVTRLHWVAQIHFQMTTTRPASPVKSRNASGGQTNQDVFDLWLRQSLIIDVRRPYPCCAISLAHTRSVDRDRKSTHLNSSHQIISYAVFCLKKKIQQNLLNN